MLPALTLPETGSNGCGPSPVMGANAPKLRPMRVAAAITDPAEPWEIPVPARDRYKIDRMLPGRPFRPIEPDEVPPGAGIALASECGPLGLDQLYVVPRTTRLVNRLNCVITPAMVLGFGESRIGLWIDDGPEGRTSSLPVDDLLAVDDRTILLYGRLRLVAAAHQIVVRYNTVSRTEVQQNLGRLRARMATRAEPVQPRFVWGDAEDDSRTAADLPHKWRVVLENPAVRPDLDEPVVIAAGDLAEIRAGRTRPASGVAVLGSRELVIANEPVEYLDRARYGVDLLAIPRERLDSLGWDGRSLTVRVARTRPDPEAATSIALPLDACLVEAMWRAFGDAVRWG